MVQIEILVHEAGHNAAAAFYHETGNYEYSQTGLQSNIRGEVYPTKRNTLDIINDLENRKNMTVQWKK